MRTLLGIGGRWARPRRVQQALFLVGSLAIIVGAWWAGGALLGSPSGGETLELAYGRLDAPLRLDLAADQAWRLATQEGTLTDRHTQALLELPLPPPLCADTRSQAVGTPALMLNRVIRTSQRALEQGGLAFVVEAIDSLRIRRASLGPTGAAVASYAIARLQAGGHDLGSAARSLQGLDLVSSDGGPVPIVPRARAEALVRTGLGPSDAEISLAYHTRHLAGIVAQRRERQVEAIGHFRRAINAVNHYRARRGLGGAGGNYERLDIEAGPLRCGMGANAAAMTSMDAYAGLVAAYLGAPEFRDTERLGAEVARTPSEIDDNDPLRPVLDLDEGDSPIPEHILWAASNLQRVHHYNRMQPDARIAGGRAILVSSLMDDDENEGLEWPPRCSVLSRLAAGMGSEALQERERRLGPALATDSAWAAVAVHVHARMEQACSGEPDQGGAVDADRREWLLELAGGYLHSSLVSRYEGRRRQLETGRAGGAGSDVVAEAENDLGVFRRGRVPPDMSAGLDPDLGASFVSAWLEAVFTDIAAQLARPLHPEGSLREIRARDVDPYLRVLNAAIAHAGEVPRDIYTDRSLEILTRSQGPGAALLHHARYHARSWPWAAVAALAVAAALCLGTWTLIFVSWWRFTLLMRTNFYDAEATQRGQRGKL